MRASLFFFLALVFMIALLTAARGAALEPVNANRSNIAIKGYDPVAYFEVGEPTRGDAAFSHEWNGATWHFSSAEHRDAFREDPEKFAPRYGGYCAWAVSRGKTAGIDPDAWKIVDDKLYLNYSSRIQKRWEKELEANIEAADGHWPRLLEKAR